MLEILKFIFSSFWIWAGTMMLTGLILQGLGGLVFKLRK